MGGGEECVQLEEIGTGKWNADLDVRCLLVAYSDDCGEYNVR